MHVCVHTTIYLYTYSFYFLIGKNKVYFFTQVYLIRWRVEDLRKPEEGAKPRVEQFTLSVLGILVVYKQYTSSILVVY